MFGITGKRFEGVVAAAVLCVFGIVALPREACARRRRVSVDEIIQTRWVPYFALKRGKKVLVESIRGITADYTKQEDFWYYVEYPKYKGPKQRLAIVEFENKTPENVYAMVSLGDLESQLVNAFFKTSRYVLLERKKVASVVQEQDFGASGRVAKPSAARTGKILGAQFLVQAAITQYLPDAAKWGTGGAGAGRRGFGALGLKRNRSELTMTVRIIDATTGEIIVSVQKTGWAAAWGLGIGGIGRSSKGVAGGVSGGERAVNVGRAAESCMAKIVYEIVTALKDKMWQGRVMLVKSGKIYVNAGETMNIQPGMQLDLISQGEPLIDPDTGIVLGQESTNIGICEIIMVKEKFSIAKVLEGCEGAKKGDVVTLVQ